MNHRDIEFVVDLRIKIQARDVPDAQAIFDATAGKRIRENSTSFRMVGNPPKSKEASIPSRWYGWHPHGRMDAGFWLQVDALVKSRKIDKEDEISIMGIIDEVEGYEKPRTRNRA